MIINEDDNDIKRQMTVNVTNDDDIKYQMTINEDDDDNRTDNI